jgi:hypothetical protein
MGEVAHDPFEIDLSYTRFTGDIHSYGMTTNDLYAHYDQVEFISADKKKRIGSNKSLILNNWQAVLSSKFDTLLWVPVCQSEKTMCKASISIWRTTNNCWFAQHMASEGDPTALVSVLLNSLTKGIMTFPQSNACQHWYSPDNKAARKIHEKMVDSVGSDYSSNIPYEYIEIDPNDVQKETSILSVRPCQKETINDVISIAMATRGKIYVIAEELNAFDIELDVLDQKYQKIGLRRKRYIWIAYDKWKKPLGAAICYRGALGLNLSFLENRCDLLIPEANHTQMDDICNALMVKIKQTYFDPDFDNKINCDLKFPIDYIPVITDKKIAQYLKVNSGAKHIRFYNQCIWLFEGYYYYYKYIEKYFQDIVAYMKAKKEMIMTKEKLYITGPTRTFIKMIKSRYPHVEIDAVYQHMGVERHHIEDPNYWLTQDQINRFYDKVVELTGNPDIAREAGKFALESEGLGPLNRYLIALGTPKKVYEKSANFSRHLDKSTDYESKIIDKNTAEIIATPKADVHQARFQCQNRLGNIEQVPILFGCKLTKLDHDECIFEGGNRCHYIVKWSETTAFRFKQARNIVLILFILAGIGLAFLGKTLAVPAILSLLIATLCFCWFAENKEKNHFKNELTQLTNIHTSYDQLLTATSDFAEMLKDIGEAIGNAENVENIVDAFLMPLKERLDFDYGIVLLSDRDNTTLRYTKGFGLTKESENILGNASVLLNNPNTFNHYFVRSYRLKQPVVMNELKDAAKIAEDQKVVDVLKADAFIVCPIIHADKALGVLAVFQKEKKRELIQRDVNVLMGVTSTIGAHISKKNE